MSDNDGPIVHTQCVLRFGKQINLGGLNPDVHAKILQIGDEEEKDPHAATTSTTTTITTTTLENIARAAGEDGSVEGTLDSISPAGLDGSSLPQKGNDLPTKLIFSL